MKNFIDETRYLYRYATPQAWLLGIAGVIILYVSTATMIIAGG